MVTLSKIDKEKNFIKAEILENQWWSDRSLPIVGGRQETMRYIEQLEDDRRHLLGSVMQLLTFAKPDHDYQRGIIMKAQHLLTMMNEAQQHKREEAQ